MGDIHGYGLIGRKADEIGIGRCLVVICSSDICRSLHESRDGRIGKGAVDIDRASSLETGRGYQIGFPTGDGQVRNIQCCGRRGRAGIAHRDRDGGGGFRIACGIAGDGREGVGAIGHGGGIPAGAIGTGGIFSPEVGSLEAELDAGHTHIIAGASADCHRAGDGARTRGCQGDCRWRGVCGRRGRCGGIAHGDCDRCGGFRIACGIAGDGREGVGAIGHGGGIPAGAIGTGGIFSPEVGALETELDARDADIIAGAGRDRYRAGDGACAGGRERNRGCSGVRWGTAIWFDDNGIHAQTISGIGTADITPEGNGPRRKGPHKQTKGCIRGHQICAGIGKGIQPRRFRGNAIAMGDIHRHGLIDRKAEEVGIGRCFVIVGGLDIRGSLYESRDRCISIGAVDIDRASSLKTGGGYHIGFPTGDGQIRNVQ